MIARCRDGRPPRSPHGAEGSAARARSSRPRQSDGQPLASLGPTAGEYPPAALGGHPGHEAVLALACALLGLIRPLRHEWVPFPRSNVSVSGLSHTNGWLPPACAHDCIARSALVRDSTGGPVPGQTLRAAPGVIPSFYSPAAWLSVSAAVALPNTRPMGIYGRIDRPGRPIGGLLPAGCIYLVESATANLSRTRRRHIWSVQRRISGRGRPIVPIHCPAESAAAIVARPPARTAPIMSDLAPRALSFGPYWRPADGSENLD